MPERASDRANVIDSNVWPAHLPSGARWLPYGPEPARGSRIVSPPRMPPPAPVTAPRQPLPIRYWRLMLVSALGAGLVGIGGGMVVGLFLGVH